MDYRRFRLADQAVADLKGIANYIGERNPAAADRVLDTLYETFSFLSENPNVGTPRGDLLPDLRVFAPPRPAHGYVIAYFKRLNGVEINAVVHGSRDWPNLIAGGER
jgi:plasmid stabilization system protein ParE